MRGSPISRASSLDGRWAYTLYDGNGHPFVHALDTAGLQARCIDVAALPANSDWWAARLTLAGQRLMVVLGGRTFSEIDTRALSLIAPAQTGGRIGAKAATRPSEDAAQPRSGTIPVPIMIAAAIVLLTGAILAVGRRSGPLPRRAQSR